MVRLDVSEIADRAAEVAEKDVRPHAERTDADGRWPEPQLRGLLRAGLGGLVVPQEHGGMGHGLFALARVCDVLGQACASTAMCFGMHSVGAAVLAAKATPDHAERFLRPIAQGRHLTTLALSEPGTGSHFYFPQSRLRAEAGGYVLDGEKSFVTNGGRADSYVVSAALGPSPSTAGQFSCVVLPASAEGMAWGPEWTGVGMRGNSSRNVRLLDVRVPRADLLGEEGDQVWYVFSVVAPYFLVSMAGTYVGVATAALEEARAHLLERRHEHTGEPLSRNPIVQHRLGELWADVERARALVQHAAAQADAGGPTATPLLLSAKAEVATTAVRVANEALTLLGGRGYGQGAAGDRHLRDARAAHVMAPTTDLLRTWTGRWLLGEPLLSES